MRFKLLAGRHIGPAPGYTRRDDGTWDGPAGKGLTARPDVVYGAGEAGGIFVEDERDLVKEFGAAKFAYAGPPPDPAEKGELAPADLGKPTAVFPAGQVSEGHQVTTTGPQGESLSGAMTQASAPRTAEEKKAAAKESDDIRVVETAFGKQFTGRREEAPAGKAEAPDFDAMSVEDLRAHARDNDINLHGATTKADIVKAVKKGK
jgi:hypothetical protein